MLSVSSLPFCFIFTKKKCSGCRAILASYVYFFIQLCLDLVYFHLWLISIMFSYVCGLRHQSFRFACDIRRPSPHPFSQDAFFTLTQYPLATGCPSYPQSLSRYLVFFLIHCIVRSYRSACRYFLNVILPSLSRTWNRIFLCALWPFSTVDPTHYNH